MLGRIGRARRGPGRGIIPSRRSPDPHRRSGDACSQLPQPEVMASEAPSTRPYASSFCGNLPAPRLGRREPLPVSSTRRDLSRMSVEAARVAMLENRKLLPNDNILKGEVSLIAQQRSERSCTDPQPRRHRRETNRSSQKTAIESIRTNIQEALSALSRFPASCRLC